jgi:UDP-N-acetylmuramate dehydrogenase
MPVSPAVRTRLAAIPDLRVLVDEPLAPFTRFSIGGPAALFCDAADQTSCVAALHVIEESEQLRVIVGGGTNLVVADAGFDGIVLRYTGSRITREGTLLRTEAGAVLQSVVDTSISLGLKGMETMTGIPGYLGGAVYGNAGAYGYSIQERVEAVYATNGNGVTVFNNQQSQFQYRESIFKHRKEWLILSAELRFSPGDAAELKKAADEIREIRDKKYPPSMKCAGSIFKNLFFANLPVSVQAQVPPKLVREGKVPSAWFLEQAGVMGLRRGDIQVATYHANLVYNDGAGTAADLVSIIDELKARVRDKFGFEIEEEVQYVGFEHDSDGRFADLGERQDLDRQSQPTRG